MKKKKFRKPYVPEIRSRQSAPGDPGELVAMDGGLAGGVVGGHEAAA